MRLGLARGSRRASSSPSECGGSDARRVAGVDAGLLDVLHDRRRSSTLSPSHERVDVDLDRVLQEAVEEDLAAPRPLRSRCEVVVAARRCDVDDLHRPAAEHVGRAHEQREADARRGRAAPPRRSAPSRTAAPAQPELGRAARRSGRGPRRRSIASTRRAQQRHARVAAGRAASLSGVCPPNCTITPSRLLDLDDAEHVLERERLEVQAVGGVVVGRDRLRVAVDHHRVAPGLAHGHRGVHAAVVELDALADAVRSASRGSSTARLGRRGSTSWRRVAAPRPSRSTASRAANSAAQVSTDLNDALAARTGRLGVASPSVAASSRRNHGSIARAARAARRRRRPRRQRLAAARS